MVEVNVEDKEKNTAQSKHKHTPKCQYWHKSEQMSHVSIRDKLKSEKEHKGNAWAGGLFLKH